LKFRRRENRAPASPRVDITSLVDVVFLLIIFLLVSTTFKKKELAFEIRLPRAAAEEVVVRADAATIFVSKEGKLAFLDPESGGGPVDGGAEDEIIEKLRGYLNDHPNAPLRVQAEKDTAYQRVIDAVSVARKAGASNLQLQYEKVEEAPPE